MIIQPKIRGFICTTAHPTGCMQHVLEQIQFAKEQGQLKNGPKKVLIIGASTGYGLASRIAAAFGANAKTIGVFFEKEPDSKRTATAGWYNSAAFEQKAQAAGLYAKSINGDAFSDDIKAKTVQLIQQDWQGEVDLVIYSLASPRRIHPKTGKIHNSVLKPIGKPYTSKTVDVMSGKISEVTLQPATEEDIENTVAVMGGEDWTMWMEALLAGNCLSKGVKTLAYSYIGPTLTYPIYREGAIGRAKADLETTAKNLTQKLSALSGQAFVSVNKALVTQASAAIPVVPLYVSILYKIMKAKNCHEGCIEQMVRLFKDRLYATDKVVVDDKGLIRLDDWEMRTDIQNEISALWETINSDNIESLSDLAGYRHEFHKLFGFELPGVDYTQEVDADVKIPSLASEVTV
ncbi:MAG: trans-2-enoyl-CoA reductase family protein [Proteobacteria bacterium]|nr:trans-2-enoyl-CoA reductase family protein [Pseudomonadota bacterium]